MKTLSAIALLILLAGCASSFERFEQAKATCKEQGKRLAYHSQTMEPVACMTEEEFVARKPPVHRSSDAETLAAGMIVQGYMQSGGLPWMQQPPPYAPASAPPVQRQPTSCIQNGPFLNCY